MVADELRRQADVFTDIITLQSKIGRDPSERPARARDTDSGHGHTPQFLQRPSAAPQRTPANAAAMDDDENYE